MDSKVGDRVKVIISEGELIDNGCDESVQSGGVYTVQEVEEESLRLGPEDTCSWVSKWDIEKVDSKGQASTTLQLIQTFTMNHKNLEIAFEDGVIVLRDFTPSFEYEEYRCDTIEQIEELMSAWEVVGRYYNEQL